MSTDAPTKQLSISDLHTILGNCLKTKDFRCVAHNLRSLSGEVEGYLSEHYSLEIQYEAGDGDGNGGDTTQHSKKFFVKALLNEGNFLATFAKQLDAFERESFLYETLFKQFEQFPKYKQIAPRCYLAKDNIIVLEDLQVEGFLVGPRLTSYTLQQCQVALEALADFHAYSIVLEEQLSKQNGQTYRLNVIYPGLLNDKFLETTPSNNISKEFHDASYTCLLQLIDELTPDTTKTEFKDLLTRFQANETSEAEYDNKYRSTCVHGDLWSHNIMFKQIDNNAECRLVDFQMLRYALPAIDIQLLFFSNTSTSFQTQHKVALIKHYHEHLSSMLITNGAEALTFEELTDTCILKGPEAKMQAVNDLAMLHLPKELLERAQEDAEFFKTLLIEDRSLFVMEHIRKDPDFKIFMTSELQHLFLLLKERDSFIKTL